MKAAPSLRDRLRTQLADLKMPGALEALDDILAALDGGKLEAPAAIEALLGAQITLRNNRRLQAAMRSSRLPIVKTLRDFDFSFQPSVKREQLESLNTLGFVERKENVVFLGPPGVGKTHLAISLAIAAAESGRRVYYGTLGDLIASLEEAQTAGHLAHRRDALLPGRRATLRARLDRAHLEQRLRGVGRDLWRRGNGGGADRSTRASLSYRQHPGQQLSDAPPHGASLGAPPPADYTRAFTLETTERPSGGLGDLRPAPELSVQFQPTKVCNFNRR